MRSGYRHPRRRWKTRHLAVGVGLLCLAPAAFGALASVAGWLPADPTVFSGLPNEPPSAAHWLGTDALGRDTLSRLADASAHHAGPSCAAIAIALSIGAALGVVGGLGGAGAAAVARWGTQVLDSVPKLVLALLVAAIARSDLTWIMAAVGLTFAPQVAGSVQSSIDRLKTTAFIEAERSLGAGVLRIVFVHILGGHARALVGAQLTSLAAYALLVESSLSYLGGELGVQEPQASWGNMIALAKDGVFRGHALPALLPAVLISLSLLGFALVGHGLLTDLEERG